MVFHAEKFGRRLHDNFEQEDENSLNREEDDSYSSPIGEKSKNSEYLREYSEARGSVLQQLISK